MLVAAAILVILSVGQTFVIATGGIDLSIASGMTFGAVAFGVTFQHGWPLWSCCALAVLAGAAVGVGSAPTCWPPADLPRRQPQPGSAPAGSRSPSTP
jgi:ribose/xylose/arabinose/galactoside ABC-type transport system permease subunit